MQKSGNVSGIPRFYWWRGGDTTTWENSCQSKRNHLVTLLTLTCTFIKRHFTRDQIVSPMDPRLRSDYWSTRTCTGKKESESHHKTFSENSEKSRLIQREESRRKFLQYNDRILDGGTLIKLWCFYRFTIFSLGWYGLVLVHHRRLLHSVV